MLTKLIFREILVNTTDNRLRLLTQTNMFRQPCCIQNKNIDLHIKCSSKDKSGHQGHSGENKPSAALGDGRRSPVKMLDNLERSIVKRNKGDGTAVIVLANDILFSLVWRCTNII